MKEGVASLGLLPLVFCVRRRQQGAQFGVVLGRILLLGKRQRGAQRRADFQHARGVGAIGACGQRERPDPRTAGRRSAAIRGALPRVVGRRSIRQSEVITPVLAGVFY